MKTTVTVLALALSILSACIAGGDGIAERVSDGLFVNYEGAEYERAFIECDTSQVWLVAESDLQRQLRVLYNSPETRASGGLLVEIKGYFSLWDVTDRPGAHYHGDLTVVELIRHSNSMEELDECRNRS